MLIIDKPKLYEDIDNSSGRHLASSVVVTDLKRNNTSILSQVNISLFFQVLDEYRPTGSATYTCSFYDTDSQRWNDSGCTAPQLNQAFNRYECSCNHLTSFALLWLPIASTTMNTIITTETTATLTPIICNSTAPVLLSNGTCVSNSEGEVGH